MTLPPGIRYSILRNNVEVPLIPIDQLPFYIQGLPRELTPSRKYQEGWTLIGETNESTVPLTICAPPHMHSGWPTPLPDTNRHFLPFDHDARRGPVPVSQEVKPLAESQLSSLGLTRGLVDCPVSAPSGGRLAATKIEAPVTARSEGGLYSSYQSSNPSGIDPDPSKKKYCTHWIRTNSCDFMQQGCKYKHEMPDLAKLKKLGFAETPKWYRDKMAILPRVSGWLRQREITDNNNDRQLSIEPAASRAFRPPVCGLRWNPPRTAAVSGSPTPRTHQPRVEPPNLIDLDDHSMDKLSLTSSLSVGSSPGTSSRIIGKGTEQPSEYVTETLASTLRQERSDVKKVTKAPYGTGSAVGSEPLGQEESDDTALVMPAKKTNDSSAMAQAHSMSPGLSSVPGHNGVSKNSSEVTKRAPSIAKSSTAMGPEARCNRKSSKPQQRHNSRLLKLGNRPDSPTGRLAGPKYPNGQEPRKGNSLSKGPKHGGARGEAKDQDLKPKIMDSNMLLT